MAKAFVFVSISVSAPSIHVSVADEESEILRPEVYDHQPHEIEITGAGTYDDPYTTPETFGSPYDEIAQLWVNLWHESERDNIFIRVKWWILQIVPNGVISEDRVCTRLIPNL